MIQSDEQIKEEWHRIDGRIDEAINQLLCYEKDILSYIAMCVAALCDVDEERMLSGSDVIYLAHARWLYWYAYRYMTNESYEKIALNTSRNGHTFALRTIQKGVNKMAMMIDQEPIWTKRWAIIKRIIKLWDSDSDCKKTDNTVTISVPRHLRDSITIKIQDK